MKPVINQSEDIFAGVTQSGKDDDGLDDRGENPRQGKRIFPVASESRPTWVLPSLLSNGYQGPFPGGKECEAHPLPKFMAHSKSVSSFSISLSKDPLLIQHRKVIKQMEK